MVGRVSAFLKMIGHAAPELYERFSALVPVLGTPEEEESVEIVRSLERAAADYPYRGQSVRRFLRWSLEQLRDSVHPRELDLSDTLGDEALSLNYLCLCDECGAGELSVCHQDSAA